MTRHNVGAAGAVVLGPDQRLSVEQAIRHRGETRNWRPHALNVRTIMSTR
jgi:hypothetical protein